jgi:hypothetical protein
MRHAPLHLLAIAALTLTACPGDPEPTPGQDSGLYPARDAASDASPDASTPDASRDADASNILALDNPAGHNPLAPAYSAYPFPSDLYTAPDAGSPTGLRLALPDGVLPRDITAEIFEDVDGFSLVPLILTAFEQDLDTATLPDPTDELATLADDSPVWLLAGPDWARVPALVERDELASNPERRALIIRPLRALAPDTDHVVVVTDRLRAADGARLATPPGFAALLSDTPTDSPELEALRATTPLVRAAIAAQGTPEDEVVVAWSFHTRSRQGTTAALLEMQRVAATTPLGEVTILSDEMRARGPDDAYVSRQIEASVQVPDFLDADGRLRVGADGLPEAQGTREMIFSATLPESLTEPRPAVVFGHGFFSDRTEAQGSSLNDLSYERRFSAFATDYLGFNEAEQAQTISLLTSRINEIDLLIWRQMQAYTHFTILQRLAAGPLAQTLTVTEGGPLVVDPDQVHYMGISNGSTFGAVVTASSQVFSRAILVVGAGGIIHFLQRATQWNELGSLFELRYRDPYQLQLLLALAQHKLDPIDSMSYAHLLGPERPGELGELRLSVHMALHDSQVANLLTRALARSIPLELVAPSVSPVQGIDALPDGDPGGSDRALYVYHDPATWVPGPLTNVPPAEDNRAHRRIRDLTSYKDHVTTFLETGALTMTCDGPCDPE